MRVHLNGNIKEGRGHRGPEEMFITVIIRVSDQTGARRQQFWASGFNEDLFAVVGIKCVPVVGARYFFIFELGLGDGGLEADVPHGRSFRVIRLTIAEVFMEGPLGDSPRGGVNGSL